LEEFLDLLQPGWRKLFVKKRPLLNMAVSNAAITAADGGLYVRPDTKIAEFVQSRRLRRQGMIII